MPTMTTARIEYTDGEEDTTTFYASDVSWGTDTIEWTAVDYPEEIQNRQYTYLTEADLGDHVELTLEDDATIRIRPLDPYDGVNRSPARVPQPLEVLQAEVLRGGGVLAQELSAVVAADNTVVTLILETGVGVYVRFSGDWHLLASDSTALEDTQLLQVAPEALEVWDKADMAQVTLSAFDLPRAESLPNGMEILVTPEPMGLDRDLSHLTSPVIPLIASIADLEVAIRVGHHTPDSRWYIAKRAAALGAAERVPVGWGRVPPLV